MLNRTLLSLTLAAVLLAGAAQAQTAAGKPGPKDKPEAIAAGQTLVATPAEGPAPQAKADEKPEPALASAVDAELQRLAASQRQAEVLSAEVQLLNLQNQVNDLKKATQGNLAGTTGLPQLVGMVSTRRGVAAEFLAGGALLTVEQGDWVSAEWRLSKVLNNGVEITRADGKKRHTLMFGGIAERGAASYETP